MDIPTFAEVIAALDEAQRDTEWLVAHADYNHLPFLHTLGSCAARMVNLAMIAFNRTNDWPGDERARFLHIAAGALERQAWTEQQRAAVLTAEAIEQARTAVKH